jgi:hypothetical protein
MPAAQFVDRATDNRDGDVGQVRGAVDHDPAQGGQAIERGHGHHAGAAAEQRASHAAEQPHPYGDAARRDCGRRSARAADAAGHLAARRTAARPPGVRPDPAVLGHARRRR